MTAFYNEIDPYAAAWLRNLIAAGHIAPGVVDERDIRDIEPDELRGFVQCHFFAGIGGWSRALRLADWPDSRPVWTGSCPCQPFSSAGARQGFDDPRHLWPAWYRLIKERRPPIVFGEQSARASDWLRLVKGDMEALDYAVGAVPIEAACAGAQQLRDRYWFVACADDARQHAVAVDAEMVFPSSADPGPDRARLEVLEPGHAGQLSAALGAHSWPHQSGVGLVAYGVSGRVGQIRALGNAIVPQVAAEFIRAVLEASHPRVMEGV